MKKIITGFVILFVLNACNKATTDYPEGTPDCVKKAAGRLMGEVTIKKMTDSRSIFWQVSTEGSPQIADDEFTFIFNDKCDTLCRICFCPVVVCSVKPSDLTEVK